MVPYVIVTMSIDNFSSDASDTVRDKYGEEACIEAEKLDDVGISDGTARTYKPQVRQVVSELGKNPAPDSVIDFISEVDKGGSAKNTMVMAIKKYYQAIDEFGRSEKLSQLSKKKSFSDDNHTSGMDIEEWVTEEETMQILEHLCPDNDERWTDIEAGGRRFRFTIEHKALVATLYYTGLRVSEALMLKLEDFEFDENQVKVYRVKKGGDVVERDLIHQTDEYLDIIKHYTSTYDIDATDRIFDFTTRTAENRVDEIEEAYNFLFGEFEECDKLTPHKFRHARVTSIANEAGLEAASEYVAHESLETTKAYRHMTTGEQKDILPESNESNDEDGGVDDLLNELDVDSVEELKEQLD